MGGRTFGVYRFVPEEGLPVHMTQPLNGRRRARAGCWAVRAEPQVAMRLKRTFGRVAASRQGDLLFACTTETSRDLEWFIDRYPLRAADDESAAHLAMAAAEHRATETSIHEILTGARDRAPLSMGPAVEPRDYQVQAVDLLRTVGGLLLADSVGLGKTFTGAMTFLYEDALPGVVVAPTHLAARGGRWEDELREHFPHLRYHIATRGRAYDLRDRDGYEPDVLILTYTKLAGWVEHLIRWAKSVVFDEVQDLRHGDKTVKGIAAGRLADAVPYRLGMTASPVYNYGGEAWNLMDVIAPGVLGTRDEFTREWGSHTTNGHVAVKDPAALGSYLREQGVMLRRSRADVARELPRTQRLVQKVETDQRVLDDVAGSVQKMAHLILSADTARTERFTASGEIEMVMRQATGVAKAPYVAEFVRLLLQSEDRVVLFGWHHAVYDVWREHLAEFNPRTYTGHESPTQKAAAVKAFCEPLKRDEDGTLLRGQCRLLIMSLRSGTGVDGLQKVSRVTVFGELDWSPQIHEQAIGRLERDGMDTSEPAVAYFLVADEGSDPMIAEVLQIKRQQAEPIVSPDGRLFEHPAADVNRARVLAEAALARAGAGGGA